MAITMAISENSLVSLNPTVKPKTDNTLFTDRLTSAANTPEDIKDIKSQPPACWPITGFVWDGLKKIGAGLKAVGNVVTDLFSVGKNGELNYLELCDSALKMASHGISQLCMEVWSLLKNETLPILGAWLKNMYDNWHHMTPYEALKCLIEAVLANPRIKNMFTGLSANMIAA